MQEIRTYYDCPNANWNKTRCECESCLSLPIKKHIKKVDFSVEAIKKNILSHEINWERAISNWRRTKRLTKCKKCHLNITTKMFYCLTLNYYYLWRNQMIPKSCGEK